MTRPDPSLPADTDIIAFLRRLPPAARARAIERLGIQEREALDRDWFSWAHDGQRPPDAGADDGGSIDDWRTWVILAGRGFGKTLAGSQWIAGAIASARDARDPLRIALVGATLDDARRVMIEGKSGLFAVASDHVAGWWPSRRLLKFVGGSEAVLFSGASPQALRGPEHHLAWCDEIAKWGKPGECWDMLQLGLRLGIRPRALVTTTPRPGPVLRAILDQPDTIVTGGPTRSNPHLPAAFRTAVERLYGNTRLGEQELEGKLLTDTPGALWTIELLESSRLLPLPQAGEGWGEGSSCAPTITRIVIGVDPPSGNGTCGIVACARDSEGIAHVLSDHSVTACSPERWAKTVADAAAIHALTPLPSAGEGRLAECERGEGTARGEGSGPPILILAERNQGGNMVKSVLHVADPDLRIKMVTATQGKSARAEPVVMLFEAGKVRLHGHFLALEAQLCGMIAGGGYEGPGNSPDRADAMVWALTELMLVNKRVPRVAQL